MENKADHGGHPCGPLSSWQGRPENGGSAICRPYKKSPGHLAGDYKTHLLQRTPQSGVSVHALALLRDAFGADMILMKRGKI
ncbi:hypothetical protein [Oscillibacter sp. PC13]|uniref:hypothetical protein n=1 Tax=Oscillibacter sp. PC13 TaxID=1855299 RepID=UPI000B80AE51|nr:hypothetical protein [Oscillibacter sp. PC13]